MSFVRTRPGESIDSLLRRFKKAVEKSGILSDLKKYEYFEKPSVKKKKKQAAARKRELKKKKKFEGMAPAPSKVNFKFSADKTEKIYSKPNYQTSNSRPYNNNNRPYTKPSGNNQDANRSHNPSPQNSNRPGGGEVKRYNNNYKRQDNRPNKPYNKPKE